MNFPLNAAQLKKQEKEYQALAIDIEASGRSFIRNGIVSIGASLQDQDSNELQSFQINLSLPEGRTYEESCLKEFWFKNKAAYDFVQQNPVQPLAAMKAFHQFLTQVENDYPHVIIVSDCPCFDIAWLNLYLDEYLGAPSLYCTSNNEYRTIWDTDSMQKLLLSKTGDLDSVSDLSEKLGFESKWIYDHNPLNDARTIADFFNQTIKEIRKDIEVSTHL